MRGRLEAEVLRESAPVRVPVTVGVKVIWRVQLEAAGRVLPEVGREPGAAE